MIKIGRVRILNALVCDDVRIEQNGKYILIGVYTGTLGVARFPEADLGLTFWIHTAPLETSPLDIEFRIIDDSGVIFVHGKAEASVEDRDIPGVMVIGPTNVQAQKPTKYSLQIKEGGDWMNVVSIGVDLN